MRFGLPDDWSIISSTDEIYMGHGMNILLMSHRSIEMFAF